MTSGERLLVITLLICFFITNDRVQTLKERVTVLEKAIDGAIQEKVNENR